MWVVNSKGSELLGLSEADHPGIERDTDGHPTGRIIGADEWLRGRLGSPTAPDLQAVGNLLAGYGVTGVTDLTPSTTLDELHTLARAADTDAFPQRLVATGGPALTGAAFPPGLATGPVKLWLGDHQLPGMADLVDWIEAAHGRGRRIAVHSVSRASLALTLAALDEAGSMAGDRIEHGAVIPTEFLDQMSAHQLTVVTQPNFVAERGDQYLFDVEADDLPHLYRCGSLTAAGVAVAGGTDAPFGDPNPWRAIGAAMDRLTSSGRPLGPTEALEFEAALGLFLGAPTAPGGPPRRVEIGAPADFCLLDGAPGSISVDGDAPAVRLTVIGGRVRDPRGE